jgi:transcriptional regulator with PAS, ATPase and Fis domain
MFYICRLLVYAWPGNVRELANMVERGIILRPHGPLTFELANPAIQPEVHAVEQQHTATDNLDDAIRLHIQRVLNKAGGKVHGPVGAAELPGINRQHASGSYELGIAYGRKGGRK